MEIISDYIAEMLFGRKRTKLFCVCCGSSAVNKNKFKDEASLKRFSIHYMCQKCQDKVFESEKEMFLNSIQEKIVSDYDAAFILFFVFIVLPVLTGIALGEAIDWYDYKKRWRR